MKKKTEVEKQKAIEEKLKCKFIRINANAVNYDIFVEIGKIHNHIIESTKKLTKKSTKKSLLHKIIKTWPEENHSINSEDLKLLLRKYCHQYIRHANLLLKL